jgi:hypothetical protein
MEENDKLYKNLIKLLKMFKNRPHHLAKFLINNSAFSKNFSKNLVNNKKINNLNEEEIEINKFFTSIDEMEDFYNSFIDEMDGKSKEDIEMEINKKLDNLLKYEKFEEATKIRDYMKRNNIKRI